MSWGAHHSFIVRNADRKAVERYLPSNFRVIGSLDDGSLLCEGNDVAGWTFEGYVKPRLGSWLASVEEVTHD